STATLAARALASASEFFSSRYCHPRDLHSFPTRRSSDLLPSVYPEATEIFGGKRVKPRLDPTLVNLEKVLECNLDSPLLGGGTRSEEHTSELQSRGQLVCRLLLEKKNIFDRITSYYHVNS